VPEHTAAIFVLRLRWLTKPEPEPRVNVAGQNSKETEGPLLHRTFDFNIKWLKKCAHSKPLPSNETPIHAQTQRDL
jgi:hypothetical protein